jgi:succinate-acetate transporter protein
LRRAAGRRFGLTLVEAFGRIWLLAGAIVIAGAVGDRADGLTAALMIFGAYSVAFAMRLVEGRPSGGPEQ